jgi:endo-1,4-beta-xylanase
VVDRSPFTVADSDGSERLDRHGAHARREAVHPRKGGKPVVLNLREQAAKAGILIGSGSISPNHLDEPEFARVLAKQFNSLSPENELKWSRSEPEQGVFNFTPLDKLVAFAQAHNMAMKGHGLISGSFNPSWLIQITDPAQVRAATFNHFTTLMDRYHGRMDRWDVATEVFSVFGGTGLQHNFWYNKLGPDYLAEVFQMAHDADPSATLFINESLVEYHAAKAQELYELVADLVARHVPIDGVALESHATVAGPPAGAITSIANSYHALGLDVSISEIDVHVTDDVVGAGQSDTVQATIYGDMISEALAAGIKDISSWGFTDKYIYTWLPGAKPHLFDEAYNPKPAFFATWTALANHTFVSALESLRSIGADVQALVNAGAFNASDARGLMTILNSAIKQLDLDQRLGNRNATSAFDNVQSAISFVQGLVDSGHLSPADGRGLIYEFNWVLSKYERRAE